MPADETEAGLPSGSRPTENNESRRHKKHYHSKQRDSRHRRPDHSPQKVQHLSHGPHKSNGPQTNQSGQQHESSPVNGHPASPRGKRRIKKKVATRDILSMNFSIRIYLNFDVRCITGRCAQRTVFAAADP